MTAWLKYQLKRLPLLLGRFLPWRWQFRFVMPPVKPGDTVLVYNQHGTTERRVKSVGKTTITLEDEETGRAHPRHDPDGQQPPHP